MSHLDFLPFFCELLPTQNVNVARFARNIKCDFLGDFQTLCHCVFQLGDDAIDFVMKRFYANLFF